MHTVKYLLVFPAPGHVFDGIPQEYVGPFDTAEDASRWHGAHVPETDPVITCIVVPAD